jgi:prepilin-type processing-associated H-X9-DG protein
MSTIQTTCPHCKKQVTCDEAYRGKIIQCSSCLNDFTVDSQTTAGKSPIITGVSSRAKQPLPPEKSGLAIASLILGILAFIPICGIVGLILGVIALIKINNSRGQIIGQGMAITGVSLSILFTFIIFPAVMFPAFAKGREKARQSTCLNNQRIFAAAIEMYAQDNNDELPPDKTMWADIYVEPATLRCPSSEKGLINSYGYNQLISKSKISSIPSAEKVILTADGGNSAHFLTGIQDIQFRHNQQCIASYVDGHIALVKKENLHSLGLSK